MSSTNRYSCAAVIGVRALILTLGLTASLLGFAEEAASPAPTRSDKRATCAKPEWPKGAQERGAYGKVQLKFWIETDGSVEKIDIEKSSGHPDLDTAARDTLRQCKLLKPKIEDGKPVRAWMRMQYHFTPDPEFLEQVRNAAERGQAKAQNWLGDVYRSGLGVKASDADAAVWYRMAAEQGYASSQLNLALLYFRGSGVERSDTEAAAWMRKAADRGNSIAQFKLALMHSLGSGVLRSDAETAVWARKAAEQDNPDAQNLLGSLFEEGSGVPQDEVEAVAWYRKAAVQGHAVAQYNLAQCYELGAGIKQDVAAALTWYEKAAAQGIAKAASALAALQKRLEAAASPEK